MRPGCAGSGAEPALAARCRDAALAAAGFLFDKLYDASTGVLYRRWRDGERAIPGFLDDYAFLTRALIDLYEADFDSGHLEMALRLTARMLELFEDREHGAFFSTGESADLVLRLKEDYDGAEPSGNSVAVMNLLRLAAYTGMAELRDTALDALRAFSRRLMQQGPTVPHMLAAWLVELAPKGQVVIAGPEGHPGLAPLADEARRRFRPFSATIVLARPEDHERFARWIPALAEMAGVNGAPAAYVCENYACQLPVTTVEELAKLLD